MEIPNGSIRIEIKGFKPVKKTSKGYTPVKFDITNILNVIKLYRAHNKFDLLVDSKDGKFLKGFLKADGRVGGERIVFLPNGKKLDKAFSLFSPHLTVHDQINNSHWDVIYQNPNGEFAYLYTLDKVDKSVKAKYHLVDEFDSVLPKLTKNLLLGLKKEESLALTLFTLLKTYMRAGNDVYFQENGHRGLTTLQKENISISSDTVVFDFIGKDGVPQTISVSFPEVYLRNLTKRLKKVRDKFVFSDDSFKSLHETEFLRAFKKYCGKEFYPHIVRSHYATKKVEDFLLSHKHPTKKDVISLYDEIALALGHKKFSKKKQTWEPSHSVTVAHYISPKLVKKVKKIVG
ncbi:hypothetical protein JXM83_06895 [Candidatus Woesearchaeota archaeon]|nr:hypothetical protein [Candidatus Woesearchaeota archaeon]